MSPTSPQQSDAIATASHGQRTLSLVLALVLVFLVAAVLRPAPVGASVAPEPAAESSQDGIRRTGEQWHVPEGASDRAFWIWPEERRAYFLSQDLNEATDFGEQLMAVDLDSGKEVARTALDPHAWFTRHGGSIEHAAGSEHTVAIDHVSGRLFVPFGVPWRRADTSSSTWFINTTPDEAARPAGNAMQHQRLCLNATTTVGLAEDSRCVGGFHAIDARTLDVIATVPMSPPRLDDQGGGFMPMLRGLRYTPPTSGEQHAGKIHMVVEDEQHDVTEWYDSKGTRRYNQVNFHYLVQFDIASARQDWVVRLNACRGIRDEPTGAEPKQQTTYQPYPSDVFAVPAERAMYVGCNAGGGRAGVIVRVPLDEQGRPQDAVTVEPSALGGAVEAGPGVDPGSAVARGQSQRHWIGPDGALEFRADPASGRMVIRANRAAGEMWWVFDAAEGAFIGAIGVGDDYRRQDIAGALDERTGRLYILAEDPPERGSAAPGGLFVADIRGTPLPQARHYPEFAQLVTRQRGLIVESLGADHPRRIYVMRARGEGTDWGMHNPAVPEVYDVWEDILPVRAEVQRDGRFSGLTLDIEELEGVTDRTFDGAARGYGARMILVGGAGAVPRTGAADPLTTWDVYYGLAQRQYVGFGPANRETLIDPLQPEAARTNPTDRCVYSSREVVLAFSGPDGPAVVDGGGSRGGAQPIVTDAQTGQDAERPASRCGPQDWNGLWGKALLSAPPADEPAPDWPFTADSRSSCVSSGDADAEDNWEDPYLGRFSGEVACGDDQVGGRAEANGFRLDGVSVTETVSRFRVYFDEDRGLVSRVESIARGVKIGPLIRIDTIRGSAESWANGRANHDTVKGEDEADANCDRTRTAGTCFQRHFFGVKIGDGTGGIAYSCGPCGDERALVDALNAAMGTEGRAELRDPDPVYARGAENGYIAAIIKPDTERFADAILNEDNLTTVVPSLEVIRFAPPGPFAGVESFAAEHNAPRGRQIIQFAGVEVSSTYGISCLLVYDEEAGTCGLAPEALGSLSIEVLDSAGAPLAGAAFEVRADTDADGVVGLADELVHEGACVTAADGIGNCTFEGLHPGGYLISQTMAPPGYSGVDQPWLSELASGEARTVTFTNVSSVSVIDITATDDSGAPLEGSSFAVYPDADADGKVAPDAVPASECTTQENGTCRMEVPIGNYVLVQTAAPAGLALIEPIAFALTAGGQVAAVGIVNSAPLPEGSPAPAAAPAPVAYSQPPALTPTEDVAVYEPRATVASPRASLPETVGGTVVRVIRAPGDVLRLLARDPAQAVAWLASLLLFALAAAAVRQRSLLAGLAPAFASAGASLTPPRGGGGGAPGLGRTPAGAVLAAAAAGVRGGNGLVGAAGGARTRTLLVGVAGASASLRRIVTERLEHAEDCDVIATVGSITELRSVLAEHDLDVLLIDLSLVPDGDIFEALAELHPFEGIVGLIPTGHRESELARRAFAAGLGSLLIAEEDLGNGNLAYVVRQVAGGKRCYGPTAQTILAACFADSIDARPRDDVPYLTDRELEVARLAALGLRREIGKRLFISDETVKTHLRRGRAKLGIDNPRDYRQLRRRLEELGLMGDETRPDTE